MNWKLDLTHWSSKTLCNGNHNNYLKNLLTGKSSPPYNQFLKKKLPSTLTNTKDVDKECKNQVNVENNSLTCMVTIRSSTITSLVRKSAPMVALYWLVNFLLTYWFISDVLPTLESPRMITFKRTFFLVAMVAVQIGAHARTDVFLGFRVNSPSATCDRINNNIKTITKTFRRRNATIPTCVAFCNRLESRAY